MKSLRLITPLCLTVLALPFVLTGCNKADDSGTTSTDTSTNAPSMDTNAAPMATDTNTAPAVAPAPSMDTNAAPMTTNAPTGTNATGM